MRRNTSDGGLRVWRTGGRIVAIALLRSAGPPVRLSVGPRAVVRLGLEF